MSIYGTWKYVFCIWNYLYIDKFEYLLKSLFSPIIISTIQSPYISRYSDSAKSPEIPESPSPQDNKADIHKNRRSEILCESRWCEDSEENIQKHDKRDSNILATDENICETLEFCGCEEKYSTRKYPAVLPYLPSMPNCQSLPNA